MRPTHVLRSAFLMLFASGTVLTACNELTGVNDLVLDGENTGAATGQPGGGNPGGGGQGGAQGGAGGQGGQGGGHTGGVGGQGGSTDTTTTTPTPTNPLSDASGVSISQIAFYQGVKAVLMDKGAPGNTTVPIVAGRDSLMRLFLATDGGYNGQAVTARLTIDGVAEPIEVNGTANGSPKDGSIGSTLNFKIPGASVPPGFSYRVELLQPTEQSKGPNANAHYPADGFAKTNAASVGKSLRITIVPIQYGADGSNRLPDTSPGMLQGYKNLFMAMYPTPDVEITVRAPAPYNGQVDANGNGWDQLLGYLGQLRADDNAPFDMYYYGAFSPASSFENFCGGGCVAGLGNIGGSGDAYSRAAIGLGFNYDGGSVAFETAVHEIGHTHGRYHSPCGGAAGTDPKYPYAGAKIGVWGYNIITGKLYDPNANTDVMGYCQPIWISDFTWKGIYQRVKAVNGAKIIVPDELMNLTYDRARIDMNGKVHWLRSIKLELPPQSDILPITVSNDAGMSAVNGHYYTYDHLDGAVVLWPRQNGLTSNAVTFDWKGQTKSLSK